MLSLPPRCPPQLAPATPWDRPRSPWAPAPSATPALATAPASPAWRGLAATAASPATGASVPTAAAPATAPAAATPALATAAAAGELGGPGHPLPASLYPRDLRPREGTVPTLFMHGTWAEKYPLYKIFGV